MECRDIGREDVINKQHLNFTLNLQFTVFSCSINRYLRIQAVNNFKLKDIKNSRSEVHMLHTFATNVNLQHQRAEMRGVEGSRDRGAFHSNNFLKFFM